MAKAKNAWAVYPKLAFGAPPAAAAAPAAAPAVTPWDKWINSTMGGVQTPAQVTATANAQALAQEKAQLAAMKAVSDQTLAQYNNQQTRAEGFAGALNRSQAGEDQQALARYQGSADRLVGLGAGLTGAVGAGYQSGVDRTREAVANLTGGLGQVTATPGADIANAAQYMGATMPARTLEESAANAARLAQSDAATRALNLHQIGLGYGAKADDAIAQAASDARAQIARRPATIADLVNQLNTNRQAGIQNVTSMLGSRATWQQNEQKRLDDLRQAGITNSAALRKQAFDEWAQTTQLETTKGYLQATQDRDYANMTGVIPGTNTPTWNATQDALGNVAKTTALAAQWTNSLGYKVTVDPSTGQVTPLTNAAGQLIPAKGFKLNAQGTGVVPAKTTGKAVAGGGGLTGSGWSSVVNRAQKAIREGAKSTPAGQLYKPDDKNADANGFIADPNKPGKDATTYNDALANAIEAGPDTARWRAKAKALVEAEYSPGENGRPWGRKLGIATAVNSAKIAYSRGDTVDQAKALMHGAGLPPNYIAQAIRQVYYRPARSPINGIPPTSEDYPGYRPKE